MGEATSAIAGEVTENLAGTPTIMHRQIMTTSAFADPHSDYQDITTTTSRTSHSVVTPVAPESSYLAPTIVTSPHATNPGAYLGASVSTLSATSTTSAEAYLVTGVSTLSAMRTTSAEAYLVTGVSALLPVSATNPGAYLDASVSTLPATSTTSAQAYLASGVSTVLRVPSTDLGSQHQDNISTDLFSTPSAYLSKDVLTVSTELPAATSDASAYLGKDVSTDSSVYPGSSVVSEPSTTMTAQFSTLLNLTLSTDACIAPAVTTQSAPSPTTLTASAAAGDYLTPAVGTTSSASAITTIVSIRTSTQTAQSASQTVIYSHVYHPLTNLTGARYFVGVYLATLSAILLRTLVGWLYSTTKMLEPFFYLTRPEGALAKEFFHTNYLSTNDIWTPLKSLLDGHWVMLWTSALYSISVVITPFTSELLHFSKYCYWKDNNLLVCGPEMRINPIVARIIQAFLVLTLGLLFIVWLLLRRQRSGVYSDPSSIATLASLLHNPEVIADFRSISPGASKKEMMQAVGAEKRYQLDTYHSEDGTEQYGLVVTGGQAQVEDAKHRNPYEQVANPGNAAEASDAEGSSGRKKRHTLVHLIRDLIFGIATAGVLVLISYYYKVGADSGFERFMDSQGFGPRFVLAIVGMIIQSQWRRLERGKLAPVYSSGALRESQSRSITILFEIVFWLTIWQKTEVAIVAPFRLLHLRPSPAAPTILAERTLSPMTTFLTALYRRSFFVAHVALVALLSEVLIIVLPGIPFSAGQLHDAFLASAYISMAVLAVMLLSLVAIWCRRGDPKLPRTPNTMAAVLSYLCAGRMTEDFAAFACSGREARNRIVEDWGREYVFDVGRGVDGVVRWGVDYADRDEVRAKGTG